MEKIGPDEYPGWHRPTVMYLAAALPVSMCLVHMPVVSWREEMTTQHGVEEKLGAGAGVWK